MPNQVNPTGTIITVVPSSLNPPPQSSQVAMDANGNFAVLWQEDDGEGGNNLFVQRYNAAGIAAQGAASSILYNSGGRDISDLAMDDDGNFVVGRNHNRTPIGNRFNSAGVLQGAETATSILQSISSSPSVDLDDNGDYVIAWTDAGYGNDRILIRRFASGGIAKEPNEIQIQVTPSFDTINNVDIAVDADGDFVVTWAKEGEIYAQRYDKQGIVAGGTFSVSGTNPRYDYNVEVAVDATGNFVVVWANGSQRGANEIYVRRYDNQGLALDALPVKVGSTQNASDAKVARDNDGDFVVTWREDSVDTQKIQARAFDKAGQAYGDVFTVATGTSSDGSEFVDQPTIAMDADNDFVISWRKISGSQQQVLAQRHNISLPTPPPLPAPLPAPLPTPMPTPVPTPLPPLPPVSNPTGKNDILVGSSNRDVIFGLGGNDQISGMGGNDYLYGQGGKDKISGGDGNDVLVGGSGKNILTGGSGRDVFYRPKLNSEADTITDFTVGEDLLALSKSISRRLKSNTVEKKNFHIGPKAGDRNDRLIYNASTGALSVDSDGIGAGKAVKLFQLDAGLKLTHESIVIQNQPTTLI